MRPRTRIILGLLLTVVIVGTALFIIASSFATESFPQISGTLTLEGLSADVNVYRDGFGIPHIYAKSDRDAAMAVGFVHAQDRLWQMELIRRAGEGRLAEVLGEPALSVDRLFRTLGLHDVARRAVIALDEGTREKLQAYAEGVNACIRKMKGKYPIEFDMLGFEPEPWEVEHSVLLGKLMAWELNYSRWVDITYGALVERLGEERARELYPDWPENAPVIVAKELQGRPMSSLAGQLLKADELSRELLGIGGSGSGSNAWVVSGKKSETGKPILANDPHLTLTAPARWYELHVTTPTLEVSGASIVGTPFVIIGRNRRIAWGVTNAMLDDEDFYVEDVDSVEHPTQYRFNDTWLPMEQRTDTILVKDATPVLLTVYSTHRGPIVNRIEPAAERSRFLLSMKWTGHEVSNDARAFMMINRARNWKEFTAGLHYFTAPAQNFVYADVDGNIGYYMGGKIPLRGKSGIASPFPGWTDVYDWKGYVPFEEMPHMMNPPSGFIATANNKIVDDSYPYYISHLWEPFWRVQRITDLLNSRSRFSVEDFQRFQLDLSSPQARMLTPVILSAFEGISLPTEDLRTALNYLRNWNFRMNSEDVATTIFQAFLIRAVHNTFEDELGPFASRMYDTLASRPLTTITELLLQDSSSWFDNVNTEKAETKNEIIRMSLEEGIRDLKERLGGEVKEWRWGNVHDVEFRHLFGDNRLLRPLFDVGPFPVGGSHSTLWKGDYRIGRPFANNVGPSTRQIFDLSDPSNTRAVTPPGQSGHTFHKNYQDQVPLWLNGIYRKVPMDRSRIEEAGYQLLILKPS